MSKIVFFIYHLVALNGLKLSQCFTLNMNSIVHLHKFCIPIATDVRYHKNNTPVIGMTSSAHQLPNPYPYQIGPWNNGKFQKISPNITDESSPLPNQKAYLIESNLSPPIVNIKTHIFFQINWFSTLGI